MHRYQYKSFWIELFIQEDGSFTGFIEIPQGRVPTTGSTQDEAEFAAEEVIDSWN